jgi:hypothetical protein
MKAAHEGYAELAPLSAHRIGSVMFKPLKGAGPFPKFR